MWERAFSWVNCVSDFVYLVWVDWWVLALQRIIVFSYSNLFEIKANKANSKIMTQFLLLLLHHRLTCCRVCRPKGFNVECLKFGFACKLKGWEPFTGSLWFCNTGMSPMLMTESTLKFSCTKLEIIFKTDWNC